MIGRLIPETGRWAVDGQRVQGFSVGGFTYDPTNPEASRVEFLVIASTPEVAAHVCSLVHPDLTIDKARAQVVAIVPQKAMTEQQADLFE